MSIRLYQLARELNYPLQVLFEKIQSESMLVKTSFSLLSDTDEKKLRSTFAAQKANPCLTRKKPVSKKKPKKKVVVKKKEVGHDDAYLDENDGSASEDWTNYDGVDADETHSDLDNAEAHNETHANTNTETTDASLNTPDTAKEASETADETPTASQAPRRAAGSGLTASQTQAQAQAPARSAVGPAVGRSSVRMTKKESPAAPVTYSHSRTPAEPAPSLGRISGDSEFALGRIVSDAPASHARGNPKTSKNKKKARRTLEERFDSVNWESALGAGSPSRRVSADNPRLQKMQLVYGHERKKKNAASAQRPAVEKKTVFDVVLPTTVRDLSEAIGVRAPDVIKFLMTQGEFMTITDALTQELAETIAHEFDREIRLVEASNRENEVLGDAQKISEDDNAVFRPPVITIMGHVDHGKTSLLDKIRESRVAAGEAGGITQHIGGYQVTKNGHVLSFLDTPGHAAFTAMRARGVQVTDLVILVVAANDGVMPQTEEALRHAQAAKVPVIVAMNKMDLPGANPDRLKEQLATLGLIPEEWSGDTPYVPVSALTGDGVDDLLEMILLQSEMLDLKANPDAMGEGVVIESNLETGRGVVVSVLVRNGTLHKGEPVICGNGYGRIRQMEDENGLEMSSAGPSKILKLMGLSDCPSPGDLLNSVKHIREAKAVAEERQKTFRLENIEKKKSLTVESLLEQVGESDHKDLNVILKGDVQGSVEAVAQGLGELGNDEVSMRVIHQGVGAVSEADVSLAKASKATILCFNVVADGRARRLAQEEGVEIRQYSIIYELLDEMERALEGMLTPDTIENAVGEIEVRQAFRISGVGVIAGCYITSGYAERNMPIRLVRDDRVLYTGKILALRRFKDDVKRVETRYECGIRLDNYEDIRAGDILQTYTLETVVKKLT